VDKPKIEVIDLPPVISNELPERKIVFSDEEQRAHRRLKTPLWQYLWHSPFLVVLSAPLIYICLIPFLLLDAFVSIYQRVCFPIYGIPTVQRGRYFIFDRGKLHYLNLLERINCSYCSYANGLIAYVAEVAGRTEQHWCPIKHSRNAPKQHSRYSKFLPYGDAAAYRAHLKEVEVAFDDLNH